MSCTSGRLLGSVGVTRGESTWDEGYQHDTTVESTKDATLVMEKGTRWRVGVGSVVRGGCRCFSVESFWKLADTRRTGRMT